LRSLFSANNQLTNLDLSNNVNLTRLTCENNKLESLNLQNGNNTEINLFSFNTTGNENLTCIQVDDKLYSLSNWGEFVDSQTLFSEDCSNVNFLTYVPDDYFEQALINLGLDSGPLNDSIPTVNIYKVLDLNINNEEIVDLTGIEGFSSLKSLSCFSNEIFSLDIRQNPKLEFLDCAYNKLIDLDVSQNGNLRTLQCSSNQLTALDLSQNSQLIRLYCSSNQLNALDLSQNSQLDYLFCASNLLTDLDLSVNSELNRIDCSDNQLTSLDLSQIELLARFYCSNNQLTYLNAKNGHKYWFDEFETIGNPNLICIQVDDAAYSTANWTDIDPQTSFSEDCSATVANTYVPDDNFEQALIDLGYDTGVLNDSVPTASIDTIANLNVFNKNIADLTGIQDFVALTSLDCSNNQLDSLNINQNTALIALFSSNNQLTSIDVSENSMLRALYFHNNRLRMLDVSQNTELSNLGINGNQLTTLNLDQNPNLVDFDCTDNPLTTLSVKNGTNTIIEDFYITNSPNLFCVEVDDADYSTEEWIHKDQHTSFSEDCSVTVAQTYVPDDNFEQYLIDQGYDSLPLNDSVPTANINTVTVLNVSNMSITDLTGIQDFLALEQLICYNNQLTSIDISQNLALTDLQCGQNQLTNLDVSANVLLRNINCFSNELASLDISQNNVLTNLTCHSNQLTTLDTSQNTDLIQFSCYNNELTSLDVRTNVALRGLTCFSNDLISLELGQNTSLINLNCGSNLLTSLNVSPLTALTTFSCSNNQLSTLDLSQNTLLEELYCSQNQLTSLDLSQNNVLTDFDCSNNLLTSLNIKNGNYTNILSYSSTDNSNLNCIEVDNVQYSTDNWLAIDPASSFSEDCSVTVGTTYVPDNNFEQYLIDEGYDDVLDNYVVTANINTISFLNVSNEGISDLTGIEGFSALTSLNCGRNLLTNLDITQNSLLTTLNCNSNLLMDLDISQNVSLINLSCGLNQLTNLDVTQNSNLTFLGVNGNQLTSLDVTQNIALVELYVYSNQLTSLNISQNSILIAIDCQDNLLTTLDVSQNTLLEELYCSQNQLTSLDLSQNSALTDFDCSNNLLTSLNIKNGNYTNILSYSSTDNSNLNCIEVDNVQYSTDNWLAIDPASSFSEDCSVTVGTTYVPDNNFEQYLIDEGYDDVLDDYVVTDSINTLTSLNVSSKDINSLEGIKDFIALESLICSFNNLDSLDISANVALTRIICNTNQLTSLNITQNKDLTLLACDENELTSLDVSQNAQLSFLDFSNNQLTSLDVSQNVVLNELYCSSNQLTSLDLSQNMALEFLYCSRNQLSILDVSQNTALDILSCTDNQLTSLVLGQNTILNELDCGENQLTSLDVSQNVGLSHLSCDNNLLTSLDVSQNRALFTLLCDSNQLTSLDVSQNVLLYRLDCHDNRLTSLNVKNGNNTAISEGNFNSTNNPNLTCIEVSDVGYCNTEWTNRDGQTSFSENCNDTTPPIITLNGANPQTIQLGDGYTELGATTDDGSAIVIDASEFADAIGSYNIYYNATDAEGNVATEVIRIVNVVDTNAPIITLNGANPQTIQLGDGYTELGATTDDGSAIVIDASEFADAIGSYNIYYNATDAEGNVATEVIRIVNVVDTNAPVITLNGANPQTIQLGDGYTELGATTDDGSTVIIDATAFVDAVGSYNIYYNATDAEGNVATEVIRIVNVVDTNAPVITLNGANPQTIQLGDGYTELGATTDDGSTVVIDATAFVDAVGSYNIYYNATDADGNAAVEVIRIVNVVDTNAPVITLNGANPQTIQLGDGYTELGATTDDGTAVVIDASEFVDAVGTYNIYYNATDADGNAAVEVIRIVNVVDTNAPVITLNGANPQTIQLGDGYTELGATTDDGTAVVIDASEFVDAVGTYNIYYNATDADGNAAVEVIRIVNVVDTNAPVITLNGANPQTIQLGDGYTELGATTDDGSTVVIDASEFADTVGSYTIFYSATDDNGNVAEEVTRSVNVVGYPVTIPKAFTPNGDTINDTWVIENIDQYPNAEILIYNRWGAKVFEVKNYKNDWGGESQSFGKKKLAIGSYLYILKLNDSKNEPIRGWIYINY